MQRPDPTRVRHAVLLASACGLKAASRTLGVSESRISEWRTALEAETGERFPRRRDLMGKRRPFPLTPEQCAEIAERRSRGVTWGVIARIYRVSKRTCQRAAERAAQTETQTRIAA